MNERQRLEIRAIELRGQLRELATAEGDWGDEERARRDELTGELTGIEERIAVLIAAGDGPPEPAPDTTTPEEREIATLREATGIRDFAAAAIAGRAADGAARDYAQALEVPEAGPGGGVAFPLQLLAPAAGEVETRTETDTDGMTTQADWLGRLFAGTASEFLGVTRRGVAPGRASFPIIATGPTPAQRGRDEATAVGAWTTSAPTAEPKRLAAAVNIAGADMMRLPGLEEALTRDLRDSLVERADRIVFVGDTGADEDSADIAGLAGATLTDVEITQANKVLASGAAAAFAGMLDGLAAASPGDLRIVTSVDTMTLWSSTLVSTNGERTIARFLREEGYQLMSRDGIDSGTAANDDGGFVGLGRGIMGTAVHAVWEAAELIRDVYSGAREGQVRLTLNAYHDFIVARTGNYRSFSYVA